MTENENLAYACEYASGGYGNCAGCWCADQCPTYQDTGLERAMVDPSDPTVAVAVG